MTLPPAWEKTPRLSRCASSSLTGFQPWAKTLNLDVGHGEEAGGQDVHDDWRRAREGACQTMADTLSCANELRGQVYTPYLESCPRTAPFGKAALWTLT
jgi:hypothetical protein